MRVDHEFLRSVYSFFRSRLFVYFLLPILAIVLVVSLGRYAWREMRWRYIVLHHTAADIGDMSFYRRLHQEKYGDIAYHIIINNGSNNTAMGQIEYSQRWLDRDIGASTKNWFVNQFGISVVLVGNFEHHAVHPIQEEALIRLLIQLAKKYNIPAKRIIGHREIQNTKCPGQYINMAIIRKQIISNIQKN